MSIQNKIIFLILLLWSSSSTADTKVLRKISTALKYSLHDGSISLDNDGHIIIDGIIVQKFKIPNDPQHIFKINIEYVADKNGYQTKYVLVQEEFADRDRLTPGALKSIAG